MKFRRLTMESLIIFRNLLTTMTTWMRLKNCKLIKRSITMNKFFSKQNHQRLA